MPDESAILTGEQIYDLLMQDIEPELTTAQVNTLKEKYAAETPDEHAERMARYEQAFQEYEEMKTRYLSVLHRNRKQDLHASEESDRMKEQVQLIALESTFSS